MKRTWDNFETVSLDMAKCLVLFSQGLNANPETATPEDIFECKTCKRQFPSFQALGGHRASHKRRKLMETKRTEEDSTESSGLAVKRKMHECSICGLKFAIGQALGGHMRRHRTELMSGNMKIDSFFTPGSPVPVLKQLNSNRRVMGLDLNLTPLENDLNFLLCKMAPRRDPLIV